jgi:hypothetical protein
MTVRLYKSPDTSEVAEEYPSLHAALADMRQPPVEASLVDNGMTLALEYRDRWSLTSHGVRALTREFEVLKNDALSSVARAVGGGAP